MDEWRKKINGYSRKINIQNMDKKIWFEKMIPKKIKDSGVIEGNSLISKLMGYKIDDSLKFFSGIHYYYMTVDNMPYEECTIENVRSCTEGFVWNYSSLTERRYDNSWEFLMEVIEKIEKLGMEVSITNNIVTIKGTLMEHPTKKHPLNVEFDWKGSLKTDTKFNSCYWAVKAFARFYKDVINN